MRTALLSLILFTAQLVRPQANILWQNTIGGNDIDALYSVCRTPDGGFIIAGSSISDATGDKTVNNLGNYDLWVLKLDATGQNIEWQVAIGDAGNNGVGIIKPTNDGGYLLAGQSDVGGNGGFDYWLMKLAGDGSTIWDNKFGGTGHDQLRYMEPTSDGGCILGGRSNSGISGDKTEPNLGAADYWVLKVSADGDSIEYQNTLGGAGDDFLFETRPTSDGGYILAGRSNSDSSADKSENGLGSWDYWAVKLNDTLGIEWENTIGGTGEDHLLWVRETTDGGFVFAGASNSPISSDKSENAMGFDNWIVKLDGAGNIQWDNTIGGSGSDGPGALELDGSGNIWVAASSDSGISGDKLDSCRGGSDYWLLQLDGVGNLLCQATIGGSSEDLVYWLTEVNGSWLIAGRSASDSTGEKTENGNGGEDYWLVDLELPACDQTVGVDRSDGIEPLRLFPVPAHDRIQIEPMVLIRPAKQLVLDATGRPVVITIDRFVLDGDHVRSMSINVAHLPAGAYFMTLTDGKETWHGRFIKE